MAWHALYKWYTDASRTVAAERLMRLANPERCTKDEDVPYALDRWRAEKEGLALEGVTLDDWQSRVAVTKIVTVSLCAMIEMEEAKGTLEAWDAFWLFVLRYCLGKRTQA